MKRTEKQRACRREASALSQGLVTLSVFVALSSASERATAQAVGSRSELEEVVVTSQRRSESLQDVPAAVTAITAESLANKGITEIQQIQTATPGLSFTNVGSISKVFLRGVGIRVGGNGLDNSVASYVDDRYIARPTGVLSDLMDIERVEVLKGPQGALYGRNASGGAIRMITKEVSKEFEGSVKATVGDYSAWGLEGILNAPLTDTFGIRVAAMTTKRDGFQTNLVPTGTRDWNDKDAQAFRAKLRWEISDRVVSRLTVGYWKKNDNRGSGTVAVAPLNKNTGIFLGGITGDRDHVATALGTTNKGDELSGELHFDVKFDSLDFQSVTTASNLSANCSIDGDGTSAAATDLLNCHEDSDDYQQEFRLLSHDMGKWNWLAGAMAYHGKDKFDSIINALGNIGSAGAQTVKTTAWALYGEVGYDFTEAWTLRLGGRWSSERKNVDLVHSSAPLAFAPVPYQNEADWSDFTPSATLEYKSLIGLLYARFAEGFKSGGFNYPAGVTNPPVNPEKIKSYEIGLKSDLLDRRLRLNTSAFYYDFKDLQVQLVSSTGGVAVTVTTQNAATAKIKGGETELTWIPVDRLTVSSGISFVDGKYDRYPNAALNIPNAVGPGWSAAPNCCDVSGERLVLTSKWTATTDIGYEFPLGRGRLPTSISYSWRSDYDEELIHLASREGARQPGYGVLDGRVSYIPSQESHFTVSLWGSNLTDKIYFVNRTLSTRGQYNTYAPPRTYGMDLKYTF